jgi:pyruvate dehydrogenase complex dehydrogenase (E1) component
VASNWDATLHARPRPKSRAVSSKRLVNGWSDLVLMDLTLDNLRRGAVVPGTVRVGAPSTAVRSVTTRVRGQVSTRPSTSQTTAALAACGAVLPEVLAAADELGAEDVLVDVVDVTSPGRLYRAWREAQVTGIRTARVPDLPGALRACFPHRAPIVTVQDASSHNLAWLGSALGVPTSSLGVDDFGQSGSVTDLYAQHHLDSGSIVNAALGVLGL